MNQRMPALFVGHGSPMNAIDDTPWRRAWQAWGSRLPRPRAILVVSAHWMTPGLGVTAMARPETIHDFGGFPPALHAVQYPAPGDPTLAQYIRNLLAPTHVTLDQSWGLDHGAWSVLMHMFPAADVPVLQLSLDVALGNANHYALGQRLHRLRDEGIMIVGSGNVVHNLRLLQWDGAASPPPWATRIEARIKDCLQQGLHHPLIDHENLDGDVHLAIPTSEHYLPLLYIAALQQPDDAIQFPVEGIDLGTISMLSLQIG